MKKMMMLVLVVSVLLVIGCSGSTEPDNGGASSNAPTNLQLTYIFVEITCSVDLTWDAPEEPDNDSFEYRVYKNDQLLTTLTSMQNYYTDIDCIPGGEYDYFVTSYYSSGESDSTNVESVYFDMTGILTDNGGHWYHDSMQQDGFSMDFDVDGSFTYSYWQYMGSSWTYYGSFSVDQNNLICTYLDSNQIEQTMNRLVVFSNYNLMNYGNSEYSRSN